MGLDLRLQMKLAQKLVMTQHLQLAIKLLQLNQLELQDRISQEMEENPLLEEAPDLESSELDFSTGPLPEETTASTTSAETPEAAQLNETSDPADEFDWDAMLDDRSEVGFSFSEEREAFSYENILRQNETLQDYLLWQLSVSDLDEQERAIGYQLLGNLDERGYLAITLEEVAALEEVPLEKVEEVLTEVQRFDPPGVASRSVQECLGIQLDLLDRIDEEQRDLCRQILEDHFGDLERKNFQEIAKRMKLSSGLVMELVEIVRSLEPYPGRGWASDPPQYIIPDVYIVKVDGDYKVLLNDDGLPKLRVSKLYRRLLKNKTQTSKDTKNYLKDKLNSALWLIKSIDQRQRTIFKVASSILKFQRDFFDKGIGSLKPLVLKDVAEDIGMHESTVSRASTNKYVHTPQGVFEIKYFFHSGIDSGDGSAVSSRLVKDKIRKFVEGEDSRRPLSDQKLVSMLEKEHIQIARRTVAKYREELGIPSSQQRKIRY
jgi:RNA polymerase sigma-54 factor